MTTRLPTTHERIAHLRAQLERLEVREHDHLRRCDTRRKIVLGGGLLARVKRGDAAARVQCETIVDTLRRSGSLPFDGWTLPTPGPIDPTHNHRSRRRRRTGWSGTSPGRESRRAVRITRLQAQIELLEARDSEYERRRDTRRKVLLGAGLLARIRRGDTGALAQLGAILAELPRHDHALFIGQGFPFVTHSCAASDAGSLVAPTAPATPA